MQPGSKPTPEASPARSNNAPCSVPVQPVAAQSGFAWSETPEPHAERRRQMLEAHPEIKTLYGPCPRTKYVCVAMVLAQILLAYSLRDAPWWLIILLAYAVGGAINHALLLAIHELSHNLAFKRPVHNRLFGLFVNLPIGLPVAATFRHYHLLHHSHQGCDGVDTDLPTAWEGRWVNGRLRKTVWMAGQVLFYAVRPLLVLPKKPNHWEVTNLAIQLIFDALILYFWGWKALLYLPIGSVLTSGLHPLAGHYLSEHYVFRSGQETYSYYGPLNRVTFNVGYHNEHHDFPYIPGSRLPALKRIAPEFYDSLLFHSSWTRTIWHYIMSSDMGACSRVKRRTER